MRCSIRVAALAACLLTLTAASCGPTKRVAEFIPTPPQRLVCEQGGSRPALVPEHEIDWSKVKTVAAARLEHEQFVKTLRTREGAVAGYILKIEGVNFVCWNNMQWRREFEADLAKRTGQATPR